MSSVQVTPSTNLTGSFTAEAFAAHLERVKHLPAWWLDRKRAAYARFAAAPMPKRTNEGWRFSNLGGLTLDGFQLPAAIRFDQMAHREIGVTGAGHLVFANNRLVTQQALDAEAANKGLIFDTLQNALVKHADLVKSHLLAQPSKLGSDKFAALHEAFLEDGAFIYVPKGVEASLPVGVFHYACGAGAAVFPHTLVIADDHAKVTVADFFRSEKAGEVHFACGGNDLYAGHGAQVTYIAMQDWSRETLSFQFNATVARRDAKVLSLNLHAGARQARHESFSQLQAPGAHSEMLALTIAHGTQEFDQRTLQIHQAPNTSSNLLYKNALLDQAKTIFSGLIVVDPDAQKTDAYQSNRNLMLSEEAEASSLPGLEIQANDVRCTHAAAIAQVDPEQLFYLRSHGLPEPEAKRLVIEGFLAALVERFEAGPVRDLLADVLERRLALILGD
jgi:Fe-S cluster assembly protein SufD